MREGDLAVQLLHLHGEERRDHDPVDHVVELGVAVLGRAEDLQGPPEAQERPAERQPDDVVPVQMRQEGGDLDGGVDAVAVLE